MTEFDLVSAFEGPESRQGLSRRFADLRASE
jgi:hypothetical protein